MPIQNSTRSQCSFLVVLRSKNPFCWEFGLPPPPPQTDRRWHEDGRFESFQRLRSELHEFLAIWTTGIKQKLQTWLGHGNKLVLSWSIMICQEFRSNKLLEVAVSCQKVSTIFSQVYFHKVIKPIEANPSWEPVASSSCKLSCSVPVNCVSIIARPKKQINFERFETNTETWARGIHHAMRRKGWLDLGFCNPQAVRRWVFRGPLHHPQQPDAGLHLKSNHASFSNTKRVRNQN